MMWVLWNFTGLRQSKFTYGFYIALEGELFSVKGMRGIFFINYPAFSS